MIFIFDLWEIWVAKWSKVTILNCLLFGQSIACKDSKQYNGSKGFVYLKVVMPSGLQSEALLAP